MPASTYKPEYVAEVRELAMQGATLHEIGEFFGADRGTIRRWRMKHPDFDAAFQVGKESADERVKRSLFERAVGYSYPSEKLFMTRSGEVIREPTVEHVPPDVGACAFWLKNRCGWRDRVEHEHEGNVTVQTVSFADVIAPKKAANAA